MSSAAVVIGALRIKNFANPWLYQLEGATWKVVKISGCDTTWVYSPTAKGLKVTSLE